MSHPLPQPYDYRQHRVREQVAKRFDDLPKQYGNLGVTGKGGVWIRIGPIKFFLDGDRDFTGRAALEAQKAAGVPRTMVGLTISK